MFWNLYKEKKNGWLHHYGFFQESYIHSTGVCFVSITCHFPKWNLWCEIWSKILQCQHLCFLLGTFWLPGNFCASFWSLWCFVFVFYSCDKHHWNSGEIAMYLQIALFNTTLITILIFLVHEYGKTFNHLVSSTLYSRILKSLWNVFCFITSV